MATRWTKTLIMAIPDDDIRSADYNINLNTCRDSFLLLETEVDNQKLTQNAQAQDILGMTSSLTRIDSDVSTLKTDNTKNKSDIATAKSDITLVTGNVNNIKNDITVINNNISALQESVAGINTEVTEESLAFVDNFNDSSLWWGWKKVDPGNDDVVEGSGILSLDTYQSFHGIILPITKSGLSVIETKLLTYTNIATATGFAGLVISDLSDLSSTVLGFGMDSCNDGSGTKGLASAYYITGAPSITRSSTQTLPIWLRAKIIGNTLGLTIIFEYKTSENGTWTVYNTVTNFNTIASANKVEGIWAGVASMNTSSSNTASFEYFKCYRPLGPG